MKTVALNIFVGLALLFSAVSAQSVERKGDLELKSGKVRILDRDYVQTLKITPMPTPPYYPLQVGSYWKCGVVTGPWGTEWETCDILIVVCDDEDNECVEIP
jgi:hypothetical protein